MFYFTCNHSVTGWMPFLSPNQQCKSTKGSKTENRLFCVFVNWRSEITRKPIYWEQIFIVATYRVLLYRTHDVFRRMLRSCLRQSVMWSQFSYQRASTVLTLSVVSHVIRRLSATVCRHVEVTVTVTLPTSPRICFHRRWLSTTSEMLLSIFYNNISSVTNPDNGLRSCSKRCIR